LSEPTAITGVADRLVDGVTLAAVGHAVVPVRLDP
jgi:hypothetical protein